MEKISSVKAYCSLPFMAWLGGAVHVYHQPGYGFWDAVIWLYYVGRFVAVHYGPVV